MTLEFVLFRHGHSLANLESRVVSSLEHGTKKTGGPFGTGFGLSDRGRGEVKESVASLLEYILQSTSSGTTSQIRIVASPFLRTQHTAHLIHESIQQKSLEFDQLTVKGEIETDKDLRERFFGEFELATPSDNIYDQVWIEDSRNPFHRSFGVESVNEVTERATGVVRRVESEEQTGQESAVKTWVILVSHGDALQILQTAMKGWSGDRHREVEHLNTANWRHVAWCDSLKDAHSGALNA
ncbi:hypothetical protein EMPS_03458 [Entomortierella parvispora]|uniref:Phosphoglycerate mutase n=1 Tax=Entomortierella parvispora TaxID=205924 RepID=A0A9P3LUJ4_9FUNG|nr:hypothetical protein EMPS_03458 [Entomortierella parvispora]